MIQPLSYDSKPYVTGTKARVLKPDFANKSWTLVADYADAATEKAAAPAEGEAPPPGPDEGDPQGG